MTCLHPLTFTVTANLKAGNDMKFNSPWDVQFNPDVAGQCLIYLKKLLDNMKFVFLF